MHHTPLTLLQQSTQHLHTLKTNYCQLQQELTRTHALTRQQRQLQLHRNTLATLTHPNTITNNPLIIDKQNQCAQKEMLLKNIKQELISLAMSTTAMSKENQALKEHILQLEQQYHNIKMSNSQKRKAVDHLQTQIKESNAELAHQRRAQLQYKQQLASIRLDTSQRSPAHIVNQIEQQHQLSQQFCALAEQFCSL